MARTSTFHLVDRLMGGNLADWLTERRNEGISYERIAEALRNEHDIPCTSSTVARWCADVADAAAEAVTA